MVESCMAVRLTQFQSMAILHTNISLGSSLATCLRMDEIFQLPIYYSSLLSLP